MSAVLFCFKNRAFAAGLSLAALAALSLNAPVNAQTTIFTNQADFLAVLSGDYYLETFTSSSGMTNTAQETFSGNGFVYSVTATDADPEGVYRNGDLLGNSIATEGLTFTFTSGNVFAVGGNFFTTNISDQTTTGNVTLTLSDGTTTSYSSSSASDFRGFVSAAPITSLTIAANVSGTFNSVDNVIVGQAVSAAAPEPATLALLLPLAAGIVARRKRHTR